GGRRPRGARGGRAVPTWWSRCLARDGLGHVPDDRGPVVLQRERPALAGDSRGRARERSPNVPDELVAVVRDAKGYRRKSKRSHLREVGRDHGLTHGEVLEELHWINAVG